MLPGIRFLLAAIVLSISLLVFGLGAAALLRAAHEDVASIPARRVMAEPVFAQRHDVTAPTLAMLRVDPAESGKTPDAPPATASLPEPIAEPVPEPREEMNPATPKQDGTEVTETPVPPPASAEATPSAETRLAALNAAPAPAADVAPAAFEQIAPPAMTDADLPPTKTAALADPSAKIETANASENPDSAEVRRKKRAERARERRRQAARRARLAAQQAAAQQIFDPFSDLIQPSQPTTATTPRRRR